MPRVPRIAWLAWAALFAVLEGVALANHQANDTLTETTVHSIPGWAVAAFIGWLSYHFTVSYINRKQGGR